MFFRQLRLLLWKNFTIRRRHPVSMILVSSGLIIFITMYDIQATGDVARILLQNIRYMKYMLHIYIYILLIS